MMGLVSIYAGSGPCIDPFISQTFPVFKKTSANIPYILKPSRDMVQMP